jgi:hypothetical protein
VGRPSIAPEKLLRATMAEREAALQLIENLEVRRRRIQVAADKGYIWNVSGHVTMDRKSESFLVCGSQRSIFRWVNRR